MLKLIKTIAILLLLVSANFAQSPLLTLMNDEGLTPYPVTADLVASYDENEMTVSSWADQTGSKDLSQATETNQPLLITNALNGYPALRFDGSDNFMATSAFTEVHPYTVYIVAKMISWTDSDILLCSGNGGVFLAEGGGANNMYMYSGSGIYEPIRAVGTGSYKIFACVYNGINTVFQINDNVATGNGGVSYINDGIYLCARNTGLNAGNFEVATLYIHSTAHDLATRTEIIGWLNEKYGVY